MKRRFVLVVSFLLTLSISPAFAQPSEEPSERQPYFFDNFDNEPTGNLDTKASQEIMALFGVLHRQGRTIVLVTHEPDIAGHAERTIYLKDGQVVWESRPEEVAAIAGAGGWA